MLNKTKSYLNCLLAIFFYALINILGQYYSINNNMNAFIYSLLFVIFKELFAALTYLVASKNIFHKYHEVKKVWKQNKKIFFLAAIAGIFGGTLGFTFVTVGSIYVGVALGSPIYSLEIFIVYLVLTMFFKKKTSWLHFSGILITALAAIFIPVASIIISGPEKSQNAILGIILLIIGVCCWSVESLIFDYLTEKNYNLNLGSLIFIKQVSSFLIGFLIILPIFGAAFSTINKSYQNLESLFSYNYHILLFTLLAGILLYFGRLLFFSAFQYIGATTANAIYAVMPLFQIPLAYLANLINKNINFVGNINNATFWPLLFVLIIGIIISYLAQAKYNGNRL